MIETLGLDSRERWNEVAKSFKDYDIYYSPEYLISFQMIGDGDPILIYYKENGLKAMCALMKRSTENVWCGRLVRPDNAIWLWWFCV